MSAVESSGRADFVEPKLMMICAPPTQKLFFDEPETVWFHAPSIIPVTRGEPNSTPMTAPLFRECPFRSFRETPVIS